MTTIGCFLPISVSSQSIPIFEEASGLVVIEIAAVANPAGWEVDETITGYTGDNHLHYKGANYFNNPGNALITYNVAIVEAGKYRCQWGSRIAEGTSCTEHNDSWLRFNDASDFYGEKGGLEVYPKGTGKTSNPAGSSAAGWMKIYQNVRNKWIWQTRTSDNASMMSLSNSKRWGFTLLKYQDDQKDMPLTEWYFPW
jgi:hypothetical protein